MGYGVILLSVHIRDGGQKSICSDFIDTISLSGMMRVSESENRNYKTLLSKYTNRNMHLEKSLHEYFHMTKNTST
jgi:hypothetical protein